MFDHDLKQKIRAGHQQQRGSILLWGMVVLLTLTVIGVTAARMGITDTRIASNQVSATLSYQGAESEISRAATLGRINGTEASGGAEQRWVVNDLHTDAGNIYTDITMQRQSDGHCPALEGGGMSAEMKEGNEVVKCLVYSIEVDSQLANTGVRSQHTVGVARFAPP